MPLEIRELVIRASVDSPKKKSDFSSDASSISEEEMKEWIRLCVEKVMQIQKDKRER